MYEFVASAADGGESEVKLVARTMNDLSSSRCGTRPVYSSA